MLKNWFRVKLFRATLLKKCEHKGCGQAAVPGLRYCRDHQRFVNDKKLPKAEEHQ
jgi:hypothetical protein